MAKVSTVKVPNEIRDTNVLLVGESPGEDEEREGRPFVGRSGQFLERYLGRCGIRRSEVSLANVCPYRPAGNQFRLALGSTQLEEGLAELDETIERLNPNLIVALGNWPMYYLTGQTNAKGEPGSGITTYRGSVLPNVRSMNAHKVLVTYHPAYVVRPEGFSTHPIFHLDLMRIRRERESREFNYPIYDTYINPPYDFLHHIADEMAQSEWLSVDIETFGKGLACIGFADSEKRALVLTHEHPGTNYPIAQFLLASKAKKIFQYGTFDITWMQKFMDWKTANYAFDTFIAAASLAPEFPKGLDFLASIHTDFPFYKEERKTWKEKGDMRTLWEYNAKDVIATYIIAMKQMEQLRQRF